MPDLLAHALVALAIGRLLATRYDWLAPPYVAAVVAGAFVPDLVKVKLLVSSAELEAFLGLPFSWIPLALGGGALLCVLVGTMLVAPSVRREVGLALGIGTASHLLLDALLLTPTGQSYAVFWPLTRYHPPTPGLYLSTQVGPTVVAAAVAGAVVLLTDPSRPEDREESATEERSRSADPVEAGP